jgi:hypothetical protein
MEGRDSGSSRQGNASDSKGGQPPQMMDHETMDMIMKLNTFAENDNVQLAFSPEQVGFLLPILKDWSQVIDSNSSEQNSVYIEKVNNLFTEAQQDFSPEMQDGGEPPKRSGRPPKLSDMLDQIIDLLA